MKKGEREIPKLRVTSGLGGVSSNSASVTIGGTKSHEAENKHKDKKISLVRDKGNYKVGHYTKVYDENIFSQLKAVSKKTGLSYSSIYKLCFNHASGLIEKLLK